MSRPDVWFVIPSASAENCWRNLPAWRDMGYRIAVLQNGTREEVPADTVILADSYPGWAASVNRLFREAVPRDCPVIVTGGDDTLPDPRKRASEIAAEFLAKFPDTFGVMQPSGDRYPVTDHYCSSPWIGRAWMERMYQGTGGLFQGYAHHWADTELYWLARSMGVHWDRPDLTQLHDHFSRRGKARPVYWIQSVEKNDRSDTQLFVARAAHAFPGHAARSGTPTFDGARFAREYDKSAERHWSSLYAWSPVPNTDEHRMRGALEHCARTGKRRVAIYGAGQHTRRLGAVFASPPVDIVAVIDDNPDNRGKSLWNFPLVSRDDARALKLDAVVISSDSIEDKLAANAAPLREQGVEIIKLYDAAAEKARRTTRFKVFYYPAFDHKTPFTDQWCRMLWYLAPMAHDIEEVVLPHSLPDTNPGPVPAYLDQSIPELAARLAGKIRFIRESDHAAMEKAAADADIIINWRTADGQRPGIASSFAREVARRQGQRLYRVDHETERHAGDPYLYCSADNNTRAAEDLEDCKRKWDTFARRQRGSIGYIFGTGPSLSQAMHHDCSDGATIACNSMVKNRELMHHLKPVAITAADAIFHAGPSSYAGDWREHLRWAMNEFDAYLFVRWRDYRVYLSFLDKPLHERIVGVPHVGGDRPSLDLSTRFEVVGTNNILTFFEIPLATSLFQTINIMGCDGRPLNESGYFWGHDPASQLVDRMDDIKLAHPAFFRIDYNDYYLAHCERLRVWIESAEEAGHTVRNLTASHIPVLQQRTVTAATPVGV